MAIEPRKDGKRRIYDFPSWEAFVSEANQDGDPNYQQSRARGAGWSGTDTFAEAIEFASKGWPEGTARLEKMTAQLSSYIEGRTFRPEIAYSIMGPGVLDVGRWAMGHPENMMVWRDSEIEVEAHRNADIVSLQINLAASSAVSAEAMFRKGAAAVLLVDHLERAGKRAELTVVFGASDSPGAGGPAAIEYRVPLKAASDPLDIDRLAFACCNAATFRRLGFSMFEQSPIMEKLGYGYGYPPHITAAEDVLVIPEQYLGAGGDTDAGVVAWVREQLAAQGVESELEIS